MLNGVAAYDEFIAALLRDSDYKNATPERLKWYSYPICNDGIYLMPQKRKFAAAFLREMADAEPAVSTLLLDAAEKYDELTKEWEKLWDGLPYSESPEPDLMKLADPAFRRRLAEGITRAKGTEEEAVALLEKVLALM